MKKNKLKNRQSGLSLVELLVALFILSIVVGAAFSQIEQAQIHYRVEDQKLDLTQQERDFVDQFVRDVHQAGYPSTAQYTTLYTLKSKYVAAGIYDISPTQLWMEGDVDGDGNVDEVVYQYVAGPSPCPCLQRGTINKADAVWPWNQTAPTYFTQVQNIQVLGSTPVFFQAYDANGNELTLDSTYVLGSGSTLNSSNNLSKIQSVRITLTTQAAGKDVSGSQAIQLTMTGMARLPKM